MSSAMVKVDMKCPVKDCGKRKESWHLTCVSCWRKVPKATQTKVYHLYKAEAGSDEHRFTCLTILDILNHGVPEGSVWP